ncbi:DUF4181 domain-containing protein [Paenibacillus sp. J22TS3]|uniref:DUF4181 domain-containing protein n=1 Tax=Paenibacillus sp. J22TS3 TaxID=2807192 RepID=UPI001B0286A1|nr:hypothetical protein J22TS3_31630 [Paenibacillus sp. J22TS3]
MGSGYTSSHGYYHLYCSFVEHKQEGNTLKWFFILFITIAYGFRSFIDWKYLRDSKEYMVSLIVLILGVTLFFSLL